MKFVSIDIETTGLNPEKHQIIEFGAIIEDTKNPLSFEEIPKFSCIVTHQEIVGHPFALEMNKRIISILSEFSTKKGKEAIVYKKANSIVGKEQLMHLFKEWLINNLELDPFKKPTIVVAGKNFESFDKKFINKINTDCSPELGYSPYPLVEFSRRVIDPASLYVDWENDDCLPSLDECLHRAGISKKVSHNAIEDAWDVIQVLRKKYKTS